MDIRLVTKALDEAAKNVRDATIVVQGLLEQNAFLASEVARLKVELSHWEGTYGVKATSVQP